MIKKLSVALFLILVTFLIFVSTRDGHFKYERSGVINVRPEKIFPFISNFKLGEQWSPYQKKDPQMKVKFTGPDAKVGSIMEFEGNSETGSGKLEILNVVENQSVDIRLTMIKPFYGENLVQYKLTPETGGTRFTWTMSGDGGFMGKLLGVLIDCEKMVTKDFSLGISNLKTLVENQK